MYYSSLILIYLWQSLLVCFGSLSCLSTNLWPTSSIPDEIVWCWSMLWKPVQFNLLFTWWKYPTLQLAPHHNRPSPMLYGWCDTGGCSSFTNSLPHIDPPIWPKDFELWFVSPKDFILILYCPVFACLGPLGPFDIVLLPQQWFLDSNSSIQANFTEFAPHNGCWHIFSQHWFSCAVILVLSGFFHASWRLWKLSSAQVKQIVSSKK